MIGIFYAIVARNKKDFLILPVVARTERLRLTSITTCLAVLWVYLPICFGEKKSRG
jgi:hypothetical protein